MKIINSKNLSLLKISQLLRQQRAQLVDVQDAVKKIIANVQSNGDKALREYAKQFDGFKLVNLQASEEEIEEAYQQVDKELLTAFKQAKANIEKFHQTTFCPQEPVVETMPGVKVWREFRPIEKVGLYVPGGKATYPSTVLMLAIPAKLAGCQEVVICTPCDKTGKCNPAVLVAADLCGVKKIFKVGGAQAIAAMAYGTKTIPQVYKIFGPGNQYVTTAKMLLYGQVNIDMPAGPSELMIIADQSAKPAWVAADFLSQLEHGEDSQAVLLTTSFALAEAVKKEVIKQMKNLSREKIIKQSLKNSVAVVCKDLSECAQLANEYAPEHLEIVVEKNEQALLGVVNNAGSIFLGPYSSEPLGDYATGANHTLPTSGFSKMFSPLSCQSFGKMIQIQKVDKKGIEKLRKTVETLAFSEGLDAHANAVSIRFLNKLGARLRRATAQRVEACGCATASAKRAYKKMNKFINSQIAGMQQYKPPLDGRTNFPGVLLDFNESTIGPSPKVLQVLNEFINSGKLNVYPEYFDINKIVADYAQVNTDEVMMTNGSDEGIDLISRTFTGKGDKVIIPSPSFAMFDQCAEIAGNEIIKPVYRKDDLAFPLEEVLESIDRQVKLIVICNPNNPTGTLVSLEDIKKVLEKAPNAIVMVDEAYFEFSQLTAANLINEYKNLIITRTFSKAFGLAGLRIGYLISCEENITELLKVRSPYDVNIIAYYAVKAALADLNYMQNYVDEVMTKAKPFSENFFREKEIKFFPSASNFILFQPKNPEELVDKLAQKGFLLRARSGPNIEGTVRVSIGTFKQMQKFIEAYQDILKNVPALCQKYAFLDRDGALIYEPGETNPFVVNDPTWVPYQVDSLDKLKILPGVIEGLQALQVQGYKLVMVTNQDGIGSEIYPQEAFELVQNAMLKIFKENGIEFEAIFICPHFPEENCACRKPKTGLLDDFFKQNQIDKEKSFVYGDRQTDKELASNLGITFIGVVPNGDFNLTGIKKFINQ